MHACMHPSTHYNSIHSFICLSIYSVVTVYCCNNPQRTTPHYTTALISLVIFFSFLFFSFLFFSFLCFSLLLFSFLFFSLLFFPFFFYSFLFFSFFSFLFFFLPSPRETQPSVRFYPSIVYSLPKVPYWCVSDRIESNRAALDYIGFGLDGK